MSARFIQFILILSVGQAYAQLSTPGIPFEGTCSFDETLSTKLIPKAQSLFVKKLCHDTYMLGSNKQAIYDECVASLKDNADLKSALEVMIKKNVLTKKMLGITSFDGESAWPIPDYCQYFKGGDLDVELNASEVLRICYNKKSEIDFACVTSADKQTRVNYKKVKKYNYAKKATDEVNVLEIGQNRYEVKGLKIQVEDAFDYDNSEAATFLYEIDVARHFGFKNIPTFGLRKTNAHAYSLYYEIGRSNSEKSVTLKIQNGKVISADIQRGFMSEHKNLEVEAIAPNIVKIKQNDELDIYVKWPDESTLMISEGRRDFTFIRYANLVEVIKN